MKTGTAGSTRRRTDALCWLVPEGSGKAEAAATAGSIVAAALGPRDSDTGTALAVDQSLRDMGGKLGRISVIPVPGGRHARRIMLAGLGNRDEMTGDTIRIVSGHVAQKARDLGLGDFSMVVPPASVADPASSAAQMVEGSKMALYRFGRFKTDEADARPDLTVVSSPMTDTVRRAVREAEIVADGAIFARDVANMPPNECDPSTLAGIARGMSGRRKTLRCSVISKAALKKRGFGGITAVGQGSSNGPRLIIVEYDGRRSGDKTRPVLLVGKAVTFDTGGISLKSRDGMDEMKFDKCGGCTVLGILKAVSELGLPAHVVGIIPSVENMPGGGSYRPGDIIRLYSGKTAEILNTDAEGRLILADALAYGEERYSPRAIIDLATLTGACVIALGNNVAGVMSNDRDLAADIMDSSARTAEGVWELPLNRDYMDMIKSDVADMRNMGISRAAGTIAAAAFLRNAVGDTPWAHLDIAGVAWTQAGTKKRPYNPKGATGFGVRLIVDYLQRAAPRQPPSRRRRR